MNTTQNTEQNHTQHTKSKQAQQRQLNDYSSTTSTMEETLETLAAMCHQEDTGYLVKDWLWLGQSESSSSGHRRPPLHWEEAVDIECRDKMVAWCIQIVDLCEFSHVTVEITMSYLDRFLATPEGTTARNDRSSYQLACMASLYTAVKIHEPKAIPPELVARFSDGAFSSRDIEAMEVTLLRSLKWRVNPPTSWDFVHKLMSLAPSDLLTKDLRQTAVDLALRQTELAVANYEFVTVRASIIAYSAVMNSLDTLGIVHEVGYIVSQPLEIHCDGDHVVSVREFLYQLVAQQQPSNVNASHCPHRLINDTFPKATSPQTSVEISPRAISHDR
jgi:hypothetical protein